MTKSILVVDDEPHVTRLMRQKIEGAGFHVEVAADGEQALEKLGQQHFDALVTDLAMPRLGGRELCQQVRRSRSSDDLVIIILTSRTERELRSWATQLDVEFLEKPVSLQNLIAFLRERLGEHEA